MEEKSSSRSRN